MCLHLEEWLWMLNDQKWMEECLLGWNLLVLAPVSPWVHGCKEMNLKILISSFFDEIVTKLASNSTTFVTNRVLLRI